MFKKMLLVVCLIILFCAACQGEKKSSNVTVKDAWARSAIQGNPTAIYFIIDNPTDAEEILLSASTDISMMTELHESKMDDQGVMKMFPQENVPIPAQSQVEFKQGGLHVMVMNLKQDLKPGDTVKLTLTFKTAGTLELSVPVKEP